MIIAYSSEDGEVEQVSTDDLSAIESATIEEAMGGTTWREVEDQLRGQDPTAMRAVLWAVRRRTEPGLKFAEFDVPGWRRRLTARLERHELDTILTNVLVEGLAGGEDDAIASILPFMRKLAADQADIDAALEAVGKGHLAKKPPASAA